MDLIERNVKGKLSYITLAIGDNKLIVSITGVVIAVTSSLTT